MANQTFAFEGGALPSSGELLSRWKIRLRCGWVVGGGEDDFWKTPLEAGQQRIVVRWMQFWVC